MYKYLCALFIGYLLLLLFPKIIFAQTCSPGYLAGDGNGDCMVDGIDYGIWFINYGTSGKSVSEGNYNEDSQGIVDGVDYGVWFIHYGESISPEGTATPTKTPTQTSTVSPTQTSTPTPSGPTPTYPPPPPPGAGIWISRDEIAQLPMSGAGWQQVKSAASKSINPTIFDRNNHQDIAVAKAYVWARCLNNPNHADCSGYQNKRTEVRNAIAGIIRETCCDTLSALWNLGGWVIAADIIDLKTMDPTLDGQFRSWLLNDILQGNDLGSGTFLGKTYDRPNNWGTGGQFSWAAAALYLGNAADLEGIGIAEVARVHEGWQGNRSRYADFNYGDTSWQCEPSAPVGINRQGCEKQGHNIDGVLPDDQRRGGSFSWPPPEENYFYTALNGALPAAIILHRAGYNSLAWENQAIFRAFKWLHYQGDGKSEFTTSGDDVWMDWAVDCYYGTNYAHSVPSSFVSRTIDFTAWTHSPSAPWCK
jgi:hypothetical protein